jgi:hypothetical protein
MTKKNSKPATINTRKTRVYTLLFAVFPEDFGFVSMDVVL